MTIRTLATLLAGCSMLCTACASVPQRVDRTQGLSVEVLWTSADNARASYFAVDTAAVFRSSGGVYARERAAQYTVQLTDEDVTRLVALTRATEFAMRPRTAGESGDRSEIVVAEQGHRSRFSTVGPDRSVDELVGFCREVSLRQFRDVIDAQPVAGERRR